MFIFALSIFLINISNYTIAVLDVNTLVTAASTIYEAEVSTRLNVAHIEVTDHYDKYDKNTDSAVVLDEMKRLYANNDTHWQGINLHHAILGNKLMGGVSSCFQMHFLHIYLINISHNAMAVLDCIHQVVVLTTIRLRYKSKYAWDVLDT